MLQTSEVREFYALFNQERQFYSDHLVIKKDIVIARSDLNSERQNNSSSIRTSTGNQCFKGNARKYEEKARAVRIKE